MRMFSDDEELNLPEEDPMAGMKHFQDYVPPIKPSPFKDDGDPKLIKDE